VISSSFPNVVALKLADFWWHSVLPPPMLPAASPTTCSKASKRSPAPMEYEVRGVCRQPGPFVPSDWGFALDGLCRQLVQQLSQRMPRLEKVFIREEGNGGTEYWQYQTWYYVRRIWGPDLPVSCETGSSVAVDGVPRLALQSEGDVEVGRASYHWEDDLCYR
jgi:hypothetical protein